ncbi:UNVERIFIED_CONTAM: hypothetical protein FKN15_029848 [Acipenser sinensis]
MGGALKYWLHVRYTTVPNMKPSKKLHLSEDVAGATFMAAGSSAPELFASVIDRGDLKRTGVLFLDTTLLDLEFLLDYIWRKPMQIEDQHPDSRGLDSVIDFVCHSPGVFITHGDVGVGTIVGSAVFNILCIIGVCGIFAGQVVVLTWWSVFRDSLYYTFSVLALIACIYDEQIDWWEALILILMYAGYILIMKFNTSLQIFFTAKVGKNIANGGTVSNETEDGNACYDIRWDDPSLPLLRKVKMSKTYSKNSVVMVDEIICSSPPKLRFPEAGLRIMITNHFGPKTRLRMASRLIINEVMAVHINKWKLDKKLGVYVLVLYAVFLSFSVMIEFNVFTFVNLPMTAPEDYDQGGQACEPSSPRNRLLVPGISILEKLIKTCPVWLQLGISPERASEILQREAAGIFLVKKNLNLKKMVLSVRFPDQSGAPHIQDILIKEEKTYFWGSSLNRRVDVIKVCTLGSSSSSPQAGQHFSNDASQCSCEIELSIGNDRLWYVNPIFIEEYCNSLPSTAPITRSLTTPNSMQPRYKRPPPIPPRPRTAEELFPSIREAKAPTSTVPSPQREEMKIGQNEEGSNSVTQMAEKMESSVVEIKPQKNFRMPPVPPRRRLSEKFSEESAVKEEITILVENQGDPVPVATLISIEDLQDTVENIPSPKGEELPKSSPVKEQPAVAQPESVPQNIQAVQQTSMKTPPIPPPRRKKQMTVNAKGLNSETSNSTATKDPSQNEPNISPKSSSTPGLMRRSLNLVELKVSDTSLYSPEGNPPAPSLDHDSYSTSSTEDDFEHRPACPVKRHPTIMLDKAKQRLSMVNLPNMFTIFLSSDRKIQKKITELAQDKDSYFGNLVRDYKAFTLETMKKHSSSTEMLQEIRQMMTQLKCYLIQSTELQGLEETAGYSDDRLEAVIEAALCKSVLKPLKDSIYTGLKEIHTNDSSLKSLKENQQVVLNTTTTDLGVTTSVPETPVMEKIQHKFTSMHQAYSPEKKIATLLKTCKIIYESMSIGCPGKPHGADDFLPVLMYVLVRSNLPALLLDVEYMMELMDPTLQLGEGSYYLTTTYGALEHIKNYDKLAVTRQLSLEIQDSIHRWERRRTLNKARVSRSSVQCAEKFEVPEPERYGLCVLVEGIYQQLGPQELPLTVKVTFHHSEPKKEYYFVYKPVSSEEGKDIDPPLKTESLI